MANVYSIAFSVAGIIGAHVCLLIWTALLLPKPVERARDRLETKPILSWLVGLACCLLTFALVSGFFLIRAQNVRLVSDGLAYLSSHLQIARFYNDAWIITNGVIWILAAPAMAGFVVGGAGFAQLFAARAREMMRDDRPLLALSCGALCTSASYFLPLAGWFVFLPLVGLMSVGAGIGGLFDRSVPRDNRSKPVTSRREDPVLSNR